MMKSFLNSARDRMAKRAAYRTTLNELRNLPLDVKLDLDISGIEDKVAARAVYGS